MSAPAAASPPKTMVYVGRRILSETSDKTTKEQLLSSRESGCSFIRSGNNLVKICKGLKKSSSRSMMTGLKKANTLQEEANTMSGDQLDKPKQRSSCDAGSMD